MSSVRLVGRWFVVAVFALMMVGSVAGSAAAATGHGSSVVAVAGKKDDGQETHG